MHQLVGLVFGAAMFFGLAFAAVIVPYLILGALGVIGDKPGDTIGWVFAIAGIATVLYFVVVWVKKGPDAFK